MHLSHASSSLCLLGIFKQGNHNELHGSVHCRRSTAGMHSTTTIESGTQVYCKYNPSKATCDILMYTCMLSCRAVIAVLHPAGIAWYHGQDHWFAHRVIFAPQLALINIPLPTARMSALRHVTSLSSCVTARCREDMSWDSCPRCSSNATFSLWSPWQPEATPLEWPSGDSRAHCVSLQRYFGTISHLAY